MVIIGGSAVDASQRRGIRMEGRLLSGMRPNAARQAEAVELRDQDAEAREMSTDDEDYSTLNHPLSRSEMADPRYYPLFRLSKQVKIKSADNTHSSQPETESGA